MDYKNNYQYDTECFHVLPEFLESLVCVELFVLREKSNESYFRFFVRLLAYGK